MYKSLLPDFTFKDERGSLIQLVHSGYVQVNIITTNKGVVRGNHYHRKCREAFYVISGCVEVTLTSNEEKQKTLFKAGDFFEIPPMIVHKMYYPEDCVMVALYDRPVEDDSGNKDIISPEQESDFQREGGSAKP